MTRTALSGLMALFMLWPLWGHGQGTPWQDDAQEARMLGETLAEGAQHQRYWRNFWLAGYAAGTTVYLVQADRTDNRETRFDAHVTAIKSALAFGDVLLSPPSHARRWRQLDPGDGSAPDLQAARAAMADLEIEEMRRQGWRARVAPLLVNAAGGLAIGVSDDRPRDGWLNFASGMLVTEARIRTEPRQASRFQARALRIGDQQISYTTDWWLMPGQAGLLVRFP